jgi:hypothetical protein
VRVADLLISKRFQVRSKTDAATVARYAKVLQNDIAFRDPILVAFIKPHSKGPPKGSTRKRLATGTLVLLDGFHRVEAAQHVGVAELPAMVIETTEENAVWLAAKANTSNGLPLKSKEYRNVLRAYVEARQYFDPDAKPKSYRTIAQELGGVTSYSTIRRWMFRDHPGVFRLLQMHGHDLDPPGGLPEGGHTLPSMAEEVAADALEAMASASKALPNMTAEQRGELTIVAASLVLDCKEHGTDLFGLPAPTLAPQP